MPRRACAYAFQQVRTSGHIFQGTRGNKLIDASELYRVYPIYELFISLTGGDRCSNRSRTHRYSKRHFHGVIHAIAMSSRSVDVSPVR